MLLNKDMQICNTHIPHWETVSSPPKLTCPHCPRHLRSKGGRTKHIRAKHDFQGPEPHGPLPPPLEQSSSSESYGGHHEPSLSPIPSDSMSSPSPSLEGSNTDYAHDVDHPIFYWDYTPPGSYFEESNLDHVHDQRVPDPPRVTRIYHPKLNGGSLNTMFLYTYSNISRVL
jgi:hypothetical protein